MQLEDWQGKTMRINIHPQGFDLTPQLRAFVEARLLGALDQFRDRIEIVRVHLRTRIGRNEPDATGCEVVARFRPAGEVRVRTEYPEMQVSIARAAQAIRAAVEREVSQPSLVPRSPVTGDTITDDAVEIVLDGNRISQHQREMLERPENYLRRVRIREYWRPPSVEEDTLPEELEHALAGR
jgi:ribosome-associated translation inhibitor RaiA